MDPLCCRDHFAFHPKDIIRILTCTYKCEGETKSHCDELPYKNKPFIHLGRKTSQETQACPINTGPASWDDIPAMLVGRQAYKVIAM